jgi:ADP-heptose:LPS heptosyltransferase
MKPEYVLGPADSHLNDGLNRVGETAKRIDDLIVLSKELTASAAFVGNDSGVSHLSAFLGLPTVVLFGPSDPKRWAPMGTHVRIVGPENRDLKCTPCFEKPDGSCKTQECMINISPSRVIKALFEVI